MFIAVFITLCVLLIAFAIYPLNQYRLKIWLFNVCAIVSVLLHSEIIFSLVYTDRVTPNLYKLCGKYYFNKPYLSQMFNSPEFVSIYKTNSQGYRIDELTRSDHVVSKCDWLFIGDSFTQGAQVNYSELFSTLMYRTNPDKIIINAGISGAGLYDELNFFKSKGSKLKPEVVFLQVGSFNDFINIREHKVSFQDYLMEWSSLYRELDLQMYSAEELPLGRWTEPFFPNKEDNITSNIFYKESCDFKEQDKLKFAECIREFKNEVERCGGRLILFLIPSKEQTSSTLLHEVLNAYRISDEEIDLSIPGKLCKKVAEDNRILFVDMTEDFVQSENFPFFAHDEHMNCLGHQLVANRLDKALKREGVPEYMSIGNYHERYPTIYNDGSLVYQSQDENYHYIRSLNLNNGHITALRRGISELVHPTFSKDKRFLVFTEGDQEHSETDVMLYDFTTQKLKRLNQGDAYGSIPMFSSDGNMVAYPEWDRRSRRTRIKVYNVGTGMYESFSDGAECWRPLFAERDSKILYIQKNTPESRFVIKEYNRELKKSSTILAESYEIWDIALSPSGRFLAYAGNKDGNWDLFLYDLQTKKNTQLTKTLGDEWDPCFGLRDDELWYAGVFGFNDGIYRMSIR